jgi:AcrR family transcriptional regulator
MPRVSAAQRRKEFVDAAVRVIADHGLADATTRKIADAAGAPLASIHYCFHTKDELFAAVFEAEADMLNERVGPAPRGAGLAATAAEALREVMEWIRENTDRALASIELSLWARRHDTKLGAHGFDVHIEPLTRNLRRACGSDDDPELAAPAARMINVFADGLLMQWVAYGDVARLRDDTERACEMLALYLGGVPARSDEVDRRRLRPKDQGRSRKSASSV